MGCWLVGGLPGESRPGGTLRCRLLLVLFVVGTNIGIRRLVATGEHGVAVEDRLAYGQSPQFGKRSSGTVGMVTDARNHSEDPYF